MGLLLIALFAPINAGSQIQGMRFDSRGWPMAADTADLVINLHHGWNLVSLCGWPKRTRLGEMLTLYDLFPQTETWFWQHNGKVYSQFDNENWYPAYDMLKMQHWQLETAHYLYLESDYQWILDSCGVMPPDSFEICPARTWDTYNGRMRSGIGWYFLGCPSPEPRRLASEPRVRQTRSGNPVNFRSLSPLHWLIWQDDCASDYPPGILKIVKDDEGRIYLPSPEDPALIIDQICSLQPGEGYLLGFVTKSPEPFMFKGWFLPETGGARLPELIPQPVHFRFNRRTQWSYPIVIEGIDPSEVPLEIGDEIAVFDDNLCVGAAVYGGRFPLVIAAWENDISGGLMDWDGYRAGGRMRFVWYDRSMNAEAQFMDLADTSATPDPIAPRSAGFGAGLYARRNFTQGLRWMKRLPEDFSFDPPVISAQDTAAALQFDLPQRCRLRFALYNRSGERVGWPYETTYDAGWPKIRWNAAKLPSGIYFYRITAEGLEREGHFSAVGKLILLK